MREPENGPGAGPAFMPVRRKAIRLTAGSLVETGPLGPEQTLPLVLQPRVEELNLARWVGENLPFVEGELHRHGALLFRGFNLKDVAGFEQFTRAFGAELMKYGERSSPRSSMGGEVYTSTDHPADQHILLHNEQSYTLNWPMKIWFYCLQPAERGGRTPIADSRKVLKRISPGVVEQFRARQVLYVRNYGDGLGLSWQEAFQTSDPAAVERQCRAASIEVEWKSDNRLRTTQVRPAVRTHPRTGEETWFNHAVFFHFSSLPAETRGLMLSVIDERDVPFNTFYGDGGEIEPGVLDELRAAYRDETVGFDWQRGDVLMLDNMLTSHGREPFSGPRKIAVVMAEPYQAGGAPGSV